MHRRLGSSVEKYEKIGPSIHFEWFLTTMIETETINSMRNIKDWWKILNISGYTVRINQNNHFYLNIERVNHKLEISKNSDPKEDRMNEIVT